MVDRRVNVVISADASPFIRGLTKAGVAAKAFSSELNTSNDRMTNLVQSGLALAPALVPIGGAATVAIMGLSTSLASAAGAAGVAVLAFQGVGDALTAVNKYALEPTDTNLQNMKLAMEQLAPAGRNFVMFLQNEIRPEIQKLQDVAQRGLLPGVQEGMEEFFGMGPRLETFVKRFSAAMGNLAADAGAGLAGPAFTEFFDYISIEGPKIFDDFARSIGNYLKGLAGVFTAFSGLTSDFSRGMLEASQSFAEWGQNLNQSAGFQSFVEYVEDHGPAVLDTLEALGGMLKGLVEAMAPIGPVALGGIRILADIIGWIADSPAGPVLMGIAAGIAAVSRAIAFSRMIGGSGLISMMTKGGGAAVSMGKGIDVLTGAMLLMDGAARDAGSSLGQLESIGGGALLGWAAFGPAGAAVGAFAGVTIEAAKANDEMVESLENLDSVLEDTPTDIRAQSAALKEATAEVEAFNHAQNETATTLGSIFTPDNGSMFNMSGIKDAVQDSQDIATSMLGISKDVVEGWFGMSDSKEAEDSLTRLEQKFQDNKQAAQSMALALSGKLTANLGELGKAATDAEPALNSLGMSFKRISSEGFSSPAQEGAITSYIRNFGSISDTTAYKAGELSDAIRDIGRTGNSAAESAEQLSMALEALGGDETDAAHAALAWKESLQSLAKDLDNTGRLTIENKDAIATRVEDLKATIIAEANAGHGAVVLGEKLRQGVKDIIASAKAKGIDEKATRALLKTYGLTPKIISTFFRNHGIDEAEQQARNLADAYNKLPKDVRIAIRELGGDVTEETLKGLREQGIKLSNQQIDMILKATDNASVVIKGVKAKSDELDRQRPTPKLGADDDEAVAKINKVNNQLGDLGKVKVTPKVGLNIDEAARKARILVNGIINDGIVPAFNKIAEYTNADPLQKSQMVKAAGLTFARGGKLPGYTPVWQGDDRLVPMRSGEGVYVSEAMRDPYEVARMEAVNKAALQGKPLDSFQVGEGLAKGGVVWPTVGRSVGTYAGHDGVDINQPPGPDVGAPTWAFRDGTVSSTGYDRGYGNAVFLKTEVGEVVYGHHLDGSIRVHPGQKVTAGTQLANVGNTGNSSGAHLHFGFPGGTYSAALAALNGAQTVHGGAYGIADPGMPAKLRKEIEAMIAEIRADTKRQLGGDGGYTQSLYNQAMRGADGLDKKLNEADSASVGGIYSGNHKGLVHASPQVAQSYARGSMGRAGWADSQWPYWLDLGNRESGWRWNADNPTSSAYGIPQSLPGSKMAAAGADWHDNAGTQIDWMIGYIKSRYGTPAGAIAHHNANNWYDQGGMWEGGYGYNGTGKPEAVLTPDQTAAFKAGMEALVEISKKMKQASFSNGGGGQWSNGGGGGQFSGGGGGGGPHFGPLGGSIGPPSKNGQWSMSLVEQLIKNLEKRYGKDATIVQEMTTWLKNAELKNGAFAREIRNITRDLALEATKGFNIKDKMDASAVKSEVETVLDALKIAFGKNSHFYKSAERMGDRLVEEAKQRDKLNRELEKQEEELKRLRQAQKDYAADVAGNFKSDLFAEGNTLADAFLQGKADANDAKEFERLLRKARRLGLDGKTFRMLAASGNLQLIDELDTKAEVKKLEAIVAAQGSAAGSLGEMAGNEVFGQRLREQVREIKDTNRELRQQTRLLHQIERKFDHIGRRRGGGTHFDKKRQQGNQHDADKVVRAHKNRQGRMTQAAWAQYGPVSNW